MAQRVTLRERIDPAITASLFANYPRQPTRSLKAVTKRVPADQGYVRIRTPALDVDEAPLSPGLEAQRPRCGAQAIGYCQT